MNKWICGVTTYNSSMSIEAVLESTLGLFDSYVITDDGSSDDTVARVNKFAANHPEYTWSIINVGTWNPNFESKFLVPKKCHSKARAKNFELAKIIHHDDKSSIYFALDDDIILYEQEKIKKRIQDRISLWDDFSTDTAWFNLVQMWTPELASVDRTGPGMEQRYPWENAGDWTFCCWALHGQLAVGPDPVTPELACLYPWLPKNQLTSKGQDNGYPFGFHLTHFKLKFAEKPIPRSYQQISDISNTLPDGIDRLTKLNFAASIDISDGTYKVRWA
tara:strand:- start:1119 stop:1946 length:828 start_codon:yes stop_codon:yes gene_type:complete